VQFFRRQLKAQGNVTPRTKRSRVVPAPANAVDEDGNVTEKRGKWFAPYLATLITSAGRLLLAMLEVEASGRSSRKPTWFDLPVMRRIALSTPNVMKALRKVNQDQARPYNFALSPVVLNLSESPITLLGSFEKDSTRWSKMSYVNIHDGTIHTLNPPSFLALTQTFKMVFSQYTRRPEHKSLAPDGSSCKADSHGLLGRYQVTACGFHLIGKETERGWEQAEDISTLLPSLVRYQLNAGTAKQAVRQCLQQISLDTLEKETGLSRHTILRARRGQQIHLRSLRLLESAVRTVHARKR
jgi:hypothetical protein